MSIQQFSYALRPGKFVDRGLFVELLQHVDRAYSVRESTYVGFGGPCMEDHRAIHAALGLKRMISIENNATVFAQQKFNRPLREITCLLLGAKEFVDEFESRLRSARINMSAQKIIWFDYESPRDIMAQLQSLQALIDVANDGDIIRITLNAQASSLGSAQEGESEDRLRERRIAELSKRLGDFAPAEVLAEMTETANYPSVVLDAARRAAIGACAGSRRIFLPLLTVHYADGQNMVTVTGIVVSEDKEDEFLSKTKLRKWPYYSNNWTNVERVVRAPYLTHRERLYMNQAIMATADRLPNKLAYLTTLMKQQAKDLVQTYRRYQRFFPHFQHVDV